MSSRLAGIRRLRNDPRLPRRARIAIVFAGLWVAIVIDLIPELPPVTALLDDIVIVPLAGDTRINGFPDKC